MVIWRGCFVLNLASRVRIRRSASAIRLRASSFVRWHKQQRHQVASEQMRRKSREFHLPFVSFALHTCGPRMGRMVGRWVGIDRYFTPRSPLFFVRQVSVDCCCMYVGYPAPSNSARRPHRESVGWYDARQKTTTTTKYTSPTLSICAMATYEQ